ncbi:hypothetical protein KP509_36G058200 [Ceratopteris richardii]|uniref:9-cis-epoxycarotenoid dioxygenase n=1 Tax=Ceratopteris richardii TaxID=49495 RepID=A0A8T2QE15_CERRI|nr:hypothetical protein KP509_36G058200 [Ceratopteris richardii]
MTPLPFTQLHLNHAPGAFLPHIHNYSLSVDFHGESVTSGVPPLSLTIDGCGSRSRRPCTTASTCSRFSSLSLPAAPSLPAPEEHMQDRGPSPPQQGHVNWNPFQRVGAFLCELVERVFVGAIEKSRPFPPNVDPTVQLSGNFSPVPESPLQKQLQIEGALPSCLDGVYVRNGANPRFEPVAGHHLFDGDGMLHAVSFSGGSASYAARFTCTNRLIEEERLGRAIFPKAVGELHGHTGIARLLLFWARSLIGLVDASKGMGVANAGVIFFNGTLLAMSEDDLPYSVHVTKDGDLFTEGRFDFDGQISSSMIAHPKLDPNTGELFALSYSILQQPYLRYFNFSRNGMKERDVEISLAQPAMVHDFAITERFVIIPDQQVVFNVRTMLQGGSPVFYDKAKTPRYGVLPRHAVDEKSIEWIDVPDCFCFHFWNAWEDENGEDTVVIGSCMTPPDTIFNTCDEPFRSVLSEIRLNRRTRTSTRRQIVPMNLEAGRVNERYTGRKTRYVYLAIAEPWPRVSGVAKVDLNACGSGETEENVVGKHMFEKGCYGGEPIFVPRSEDPTADEDDGYILTYVHNEDTDKSELLVLDAKSPSLAKLAAVKLPSRVPYGFHGTFVPAHKLREQ